MSFSCGGVNDYIEFGPRGGCFSMWFKTTQVPGGTPSEILSQHSGSASGPGWGCTFASNGTLAFYGKSSPSTQIFGSTSSGVINDGNWHHLAICCWFSTALPQAIWVDGVLVWNQFNAGNFNYNGNGRIGRSVDGFWGGFVGKVAEFAIWGGGGYSGYLTDDAIKALAKGINPRSVYLRDLHAYMPLRYNVNDLIANVSGQPFTSGGSFVEDHPPVFR